MEAAEAEELAQELGLGNNTDDSLRQLILKRQADRGAAFDGIIAGLEAKYYQPKKVKGSKARSGKKKK